MLDSTASSLKPYYAEIEHTLEQVLTPAEPEQLWSAMRYSVLGGGKRLRALLCLFACQAVKGQWQQALPAAAAVELIHAYSLIHDDLPALDNDDWRRGKPSNHKRFGEDLAILAGDALQSLAFELLLKTDQPAELCLKLIAELVIAVGPEGMCAGQVMDMHAPENPNAEMILKTYQLKTGALIRAAVRMGALLGHASDMQLEALTDYAEKLGQSFQIIDDLLDISGSFEELGKTPGKDSEQNKLTYPAIVGLGAAQQLVEDNYSQALNTLKQAGLLTAGLELLANKLIQRRK